MKRVLIAAALGASIAAGGGAWGHGGAHKKERTEPPQAAEETSFGKAGDPNKVSRTVHVLMSDDMRFTPSRLKVKRGETIRFVVKNEGAVMHEMVLGTMDDLKQHAELMKKHPEMEHDEPYMAHVDPGKTETIVWQFSKSGEFFYACLLPGHFEAGMLGKIAVAPRSERTSMLVRSRQP